MTTIGERFLRLHESGIFVMPNPWDVGSARRFEQMGFPALATTSSGHAASLGKQDQEATFDELLDHVGRLCASVDIPLNVDLEWGFADDPDGLAEVIDALADAGAAGCSLEDFDPRSKAVVPVERAVARIEAGAAAAARRGIVLTARAENHLYGHDDGDDTLDRLRAYAAAGAPVIYAPGVSDADTIARIVAIGPAVNVLALPGVPTVGQLAELGVRRVSTGGALANVAYRAAEAAAAELRDQGTTGYFGR